MQPIGFQFLYGAIQTRAILYHVAMNLMFQFLYGAIHTRETIVVTHALVTFQFLYGAIEVKLQEQLKIC